MNRLVEHLRNKMTAGLFAAVPVIVVAYAAYWVETNTRAVAAPLGIRAPGLGVLAAIAGVYVLGLLVTSVLGKIMLGVVNSILERVPGLRLIYRVWKDLLVLPADKAGMFHQAVLVPVGEGRVQMGFTSGRPLDADPNSVCVFVPSVPNPISGTLYVVPREVCIPLKLSVEEAFKFLISSGNYLPPALVGIPANMKDL